MASIQTYLDLISQYESGNRNVPNYKFGPGYTAQGYYQITNTNWNNIAPMLGIDTAAYPSAMSAPLDLQAQVASYLLTQTPAGVSNWSSYNPRLLSALNNAGLQTAGPVSDSLPVADGAPLIDLAGDAAGLPTGDLLSEIESGALDLTSLDSGTGAGIGAVLLIGAGLLAAVLLTN